MKRISILGISLLILVPQITSAAWWNPGSWFKKALPTQIETSVSEPVEISVSTSVNEVGSEGEIEEPVEIQTRIVEKIIQVDNPVLQTKIDLLTKQNADLQLKLQSLSSVTEQLNMCKASLTQTKQASNISLREQKLRLIDAEMLAILDPLYEKLLEHPDGVGIGYTLTNYNTLVANINTIIDKYKIADPQFSYPKLNVSFQIVDGVKKWDYPLGILMGFRDWLYDYIDFRNFN